MNQKIELRKRFFALRDAIGLDRRKEASEALFERFKNVQGQILIFMPFASEIDVMSLNHFLASRGRLVLPRREDTVLDFYRIEDFEHQLEIVPPGIREPLPARSFKVDLSELDLILATGLAFDQDRYRLGYGKGHYDRFMKHSSIPIIGIGFREQLTLTPLPHDSWDIPMSEIILF